MVAGVPIGQEGEQGGEGQGREGDADGGAGVGGQGGHNLPHECAVEGQEDPLGGQEVALHGQEEEVWGALQQGGQAGGQSTAVASHGLRLG